MSSTTTDQQVPATGASREGLVAPLRLLDAAATEERRQRFLGGIARLRVNSASLRLDERLLLALGGVIAPLGLIVVLLGWWGASHTPYVFEQLPYLISGGLFGVGLIFLGGFLYFAHWMTQLIKEHRAQSAAVLEVLQRLEQHLGATAAPAVAPVAARNGSRPVEPVASTLRLVATERGTMAHRPECVVVAGKERLRTVGEADDLAACKLCEPF